jgi:outer membrane protein
MRRLVVAFVLALSTQAAHAQQPDTLVLTLERALEIARRNNPTYLRAANQLELNGAETRAGLMGTVLPSVSLNLLSTSYTGNLTRRATDNFGNPIDNPNAEFVYFSGTDQGLALSWALRGPSPWYDFKQTRLGNENRELGEESAGEALRLAVLRGFYSALGQDELLAAEREIAAATRTDFEAAQRLFEIGLKTRVEVLNAELQIEQQQLAVRQQEGARDRARLALETLLGQTDLPPVRPAPLEIPLFDPATLDEEALVERAVAGSASVRRAEVELRVAQVAVQESRTAYWPEIRAGFTVGRNEQGPRTESLFAFGGFEDELSSRLNVSLSLPLFNNFFGSRVNMARAEVARASGEDDLRQARLEAERATRSALVTLRDRWDGLRIAERSLTIATEALELAREEYRLGARTFEQLQQSVASEATGRRQVIQARYGFADALIDLEAAVGGPVR